MKFSYRVESEYLLRDISLAIEKESAHLLTGADSFLLGMIGGIVAKLLPIKEKLAEWPQLQAIMRNYTGDLIIEEGALPDSGVYIGPDPDQHLIFSNVEEELKIHVSDPYRRVQVLTSFGLDKSFYDRDISTLSGGEKMKLALAIAFSMNPECYVLHGVIPWLDQGGRKLLLETICHVKQKASVVFMDHEHYHLRNTVDHVYELNAGKIIERDREQFFEDPVHGDLIKGRISEGGSNKLLEFRNVTFASYPSTRLSRETPLLNNISFDLCEGNAYMLMGDNGAGKSTIAKLIFRTIEPDSGSILLRDEPLTRYARHELCELICYVSQFPEQQIIYSNIGQYRLNAKRKRNALSSTLLQDWIKLEDNYPVSSLSIFERRMLLLTSLVTKSTKLIILDEPSWGLSEYDLKMTFKLLTQILEELKCAVLMVTHDFELAIRLNTNAFWLNKGDLFFFEKVRDLYTEYVGE